jgi:ERF superfamily
VTDQPAIHATLAAVKAAIGAVGKDSRNQKQGFDFRGVDAVVNAAAPHLNAHGVVVTPMVQSVDYATIEAGNNRTPMGHVRVVVMYRFTGPAGDHLDAVVPAEAMDSGDKATAKAMSVAYRIALLQTLNLPTCDPDPDSQSYERSPRAVELARPVSTDADWFDELVAAAALFETADEGRTLWRRVSEKHRSGGCSPDDAQLLQQTIRARQAELEPVPAHNGNGNGHGQLNGHNGGAG